MSTPATLPGLALWLDGAQVAYSDAGTTVAAAPYGRVAQIAQPSPLSGNWTASGTFRPWRESSSLDFHSGERTALHAPDVSVPSNNCTIAFAWHTRGGQQIAPLIQAAHSAGGILSLLVQSFYYLQAPGLSDDFLPGLPIPTPGHEVVHCTLVVTFSPTNVHFRLTNNGVEHTTTISSAPGSGSFGSFVIGERAGYAYGQYAVSQYVVTSQALTESEQDDLQAYLLSKPANNPPVDAPLITMIGDSIGAGWPPKYQATLSGIDNPPRVINVGAAGTGTVDPAQIPSYYTTDALPHFSSSREKNIIICEGISINDVGGRIESNPPETVAEIVLPAYYAVLDQAKADGYTVIACTLTPSTRGPAYEECRTIINTDIRANYLAHAHYLMDNGAAPGMSSPEDAANTTYFSDGTHVTATGYLVWDDLLVPILIEALAADEDVDPPIDPPVTSRSHRAQMQGRNTVTQEIVTWLADAPDWAGEQSPVPVADVVLYVGARVASS